MRLAQLTASVTLTTALLIGSGVAFASAASAAYPTCNTVGIRNGIAIPYSSASGTYTCNLRQGNSGGAVTALQDSLNTCQGASLAVDGSFGPATRAALVAFQQSRGLVADGIYGPATRNALQWVFWSNGTPRPSCHAY
ncbi:peptidoglycan-binding domain-containing protein [Oerskovia gallyi]|uniref:Peptidoglycan-binding protein n=1 Tax=Oerskovia gallyi TaxID=2762226 RepID=A0ABR8V1V4_9CELL|nr:peptidoglycan-binding domain-containing protein [Oerskovia gallyi]MBD7998770.1 peptidoglycan-binding protein [Oerskovia gallyi]